MIKLTERGFIKHTRRKICQKNEGDVLDFYPKYQGGTRKTNKKESTQTHSGGTTRNRAHTSANV